MRVLEVETFGRGGLLHYAYNLSAALAERGHEVVLLTTAGDELEGHIAPTANLRLVRAIGRIAHRHRGSRPVFVATILRRAEALLDAFRVALIARRLRPDVIHLHCTNSIALAYLALLRLLRVPLVTTAHVITPHEPMPFERTVFGAIHRLGHLVVAHSEVDRQRLLTEVTLDPERMVVIPHGEYGFFERTAEPADRDEARRSLGLQVDDEVALFFGYIREYKGLDVLLEAWPEVAKKRPRARLVVAGDPVQLDPERRDQLERWATRLGVVHRFAYIPFCDVSRTFAAADVLVMPYRSISQSGVLFLALALGVPVLATRVGALPELLRDGDSALLVPPESPAALTEALVRALGDEELRARLAEGGRQLASAHSWSSIAERTEAAFVRLAQD